MRKSIITLLCTLGLAISAAPAAAADTSSNRETRAAASTLTVRADAPARYTVRRGDTLWGISKRYLNSPWKWPQLWGFNKSQIRNPHRIYPGQVLVLTYVDGQPRLSIEDSGAVPTIKLSPQAHDTTDGYSIPTLPMSVLKSFMDYPSIIDKSITDKAPKIIAGPDKRMMFSPGDRVYAHGIEKPGRYLIYRINGDVTDPVTGHSLGQEVVYNGEVATLTSRRGGPTVQRDGTEYGVEPNERTTNLAPVMKIATDVATPMEVLKAASEIFTGDKLLYIEEGSHDRFNFVPHEPDNQVQARVVRIFKGVREAGQYQTILLNKGENDGIDRGTVLGLYRLGKVAWSDGKKVDRFSIRNTQKFTALPAEKIGTAMIYRTSENLSYALIIESNTNINLGDIASNPGLDLEDLPVHAVHIPNK